MYLSGLKLKTWQKTNDTNLKVEKQTNTNEAIDNPTQLQKITIAHKSYMSDNYKSIEVTINPKNKAVIYKKIFNPKTNKLDKIPFTVQIGISENSWHTTYHFLEPRTKEEIGYVTICDWNKAKDDKIKDYIFDNSILYDHPENGIIGERITIDRLQNNNENLYSGIGKAADHIAVEYCLKEGIKPQIVSVAELDSAIAHYKRGRRFFLIDAKTLPIGRYNEFTSKFNTSDPNKVIEEKIKESEITGEKVRCDDLGYLEMYMPNKVVLEYLKEIQKNHYLH